MDAPPELYLKLEDGETVSGAVRAAEVEYCGEPVDVDSIIALDRTTLFLRGTRQLPVTRQYGELRGFLELWVVGRGAVRVDLSRVDSVFRPPHRVASPGAAGGVGADVD